MTGSTPLLSNAKVILITPVPRYEPGDGSTWMIARRPDARKRTGFLSLREKSWCIGVHFDGRYFFYRNIMFKWKIADALVIHEIGFRIL